MKRKPMGCLFCVVCVILFLTGCGFPDLSEIYSSEDTFSVEHETSTINDADEEDTQEIAKVYVHVCGCVKKPGLYVLHEGDRIDAAIREAGGFTKNADERSVNLAELLVDGTQIEVQSLTKDSDLTNSGSEGDTKVNINDADQTTLTTLSGIGDSRAAAIIAYREEHGSFSSIEDIKEVDGIGDGIYQKIKNSITV